MGSYWKWLRNEVSVEAIISGGVADGVLSGLLLFISMAPFVVSVFHLMPNLSEAQFMTQFAIYASTSQYFVITATLFGGIATIFGGYLAASLAKRSELLNGFLAGIISLLIAGIDYFSGNADPKYSAYLPLFKQSGSFEMWLTIFLTILTPFLALSGAYFYLKFGRLDLSSAPLRLWKKIGFYPNIFDGRMGRWAFLCSGVALLVVYIVSVVAIFIFFGFVSSVIGVNLWLLSLFLIVVLGIIFGIWAYSLTVRRLHDIDLRGWLALTYYTHYVTIVFSFFILLWPGTKGANPFGDPHDEFSLAYTVTGKELQKT